MAGKRILIKTDEANFDPVDELRNEFQLSTDDYLAYCKEEGLEPARLYLSCP